MNPMASHFALFLAGFILGVACGVGCTLYLARRVTEICDMIHEVSQQM